MRGHVRQRLLAQERESPDTVLEWDSSAVFHRWPSRRVSNQRLWNGAMHLPGRLMSSLLGKKFNHVLSLLWAVLGNLSRILGSVEGRKCRMEPVDKCITGFGLYILREAGQLRRKIFDCWQRSLCLFFIIQNHYAYFWKPHLHFSVFLLLDFFLQITVTIILPRHWYNGCRSICHLFMWQVGLTKQLGKRTAFLIGVRR